MSKRTAKKGTTAATLKAMASGRKTANAANNDAEPTALTLLLPDLPSGVRLSEVGIALPPDLPWEQYERIWTAAGRARDTVQWVVVDLVHLGMSRADYSTKYMEFTERWGYTEETLANLNWFPEFSLRNENLTMTHHTVVASQEPHDRQRWLDRAEAGRWSSKELRRQIIALTLDAVQKEDADAEAGEIEHADTDTGTGAEETGTAEAGADTGTGTEDLRSAADAIEGTEHTGTDELTEEKEAAP